jgi:hypothetical protein
MTADQVSEATKSESVVEVSNLKSGPVLRGRWEKGDESIFFVTTPMVEGYKVIKIEYVAATDSSQRFETLRAALAKRYGNPSARMALAEAGLKCVAPNTDCGLSYGWGHVRVDLGTVVPDPSGRAIVMRALRSKRYVIKVTIADGPLIAKYLAKGEDDTYEQQQKLLAQATAQDSFAARLKSLAAFADSMVEGKVSRIYFYDETDFLLDHDRVEQGHPPLRGVVGFPKQWKLRDGVVRRLKVPYPSRSEIINVLGTPQETRMNNSCLDWAADPAPPLFSQFEVCFDAGGHLMLLQLEGLEPVNDGYSSEMVSSEYSSWSHTIHHPRHTP